MNPQYKKGILELCILSMLMKHERYGYEIAEQLSSHIDIADGTVYPILRKLRGEGLLNTYLQEDSGGPPRKYYSLTKAGKATFLKERAEYIEFADSVAQLLDFGSNRGKQI